MEQICHIGTVIRTSPERVQVLIEQVSACDMCRAKKFCTAADVREKTIDARTGGQTFAVGDKVVVSARGSMGLKAVWVAYVLPLAVMMAVLFVVAGLMPGKEAVAALAALGALAVYYVILAFMRNRVRQSFTFEVRPAADSDFDNE